MKRLILLAVSAIMFFSVYAQEKSDSRANANVIYKVVPKKLNIQDVIKVRNRSPYLVLQIVVAEVVGNDLKPLGSITGIEPNQTREIGAFKKNSLKYLKGKTIAIKAKALTAAIEDLKGKDIYTPFGGVFVRGRDIDKETMNNIRPEDITYEFQAELFEDHHDLYIDLYSASGNDIMNF